MDNKWLSLLLTLYLFPGCRIGSTLGQSDWHWRSPRGLRADHAHLSSILMEIHHNLKTNDSGVCSMIYRILRQTQLSPTEECRRLNKSRQSSLGDVAEFYRALSMNGSFNDTLDFPLADKFPRFSFRASFVPLPMYANEPAVMIETGSHSGHIVCVQSVPCPPVSTIAVVATTTAPSPSTTPLSMPIPVEGAPPGTDILHSASSLPNNYALATFSNNDAFWKALLSGTKPETWFIATVCLSVVAFLLLLMLVLTWLYVCRIRRLHKRRRCRGTCRSGCRCPPETVRKSLTEAAVRGPFEPVPMQYKQMISASLSSHGNGSIHNGVLPLSISGGPYGGSYAHPFTTHQQQHIGTLTGNRWCGSPSQKTSIGAATPLCASMINGGEKTALLPNSNYPNNSGGSYIIQTPSEIGHSRTLEACNWTSGGGNSALPQRSTSQIYRRRLSHEAIHHVNNNINNNVSDGSSISDHAGKMTVTHSMQQQQPSRFAFLSAANSHLNSQEYAESDTATPLPTASIHLMGRNGEESPYGRLPETRPPATDEQILHSRIMIVSSCPPTYSLMSSLPSNTSNTVPIYKKGFTNIGEYIDRSEMSAAMQVSQMGLSGVATGTTSPLYYIAHGGTNQVGAETLQSASLASVAQDIKGTNDYTVSTTSPKGGGNGHYSGTRLTARDHSLIPGEVQVVDIAPPSGFFDNNTAGGVLTSDGCSMTLNPSLIIRNSGVIGIGNGDISPDNTTTVNGPTILDGSTNFTNTTLRSAPLSVENCNSLYRPMLLLDGDNITRSDAGWLPNDSEMVGTVDRATTPMNDSHLIISRSGPSVKDNQLLHHHQGVDVSRCLLPPRMYAETERML